LHAARPKRGRRLGILTFDHPRAILEARTGAAEGTAVSDDRSGRVTERRDADVVGLERRG
jgi:hypothetical protein